MPQQDETLVDADGNLRPSVHLDSPPSETTIVARAQKRRLWIPLTVEEFVAAMVMLVLTLITLGNVITRYFLNASFAFTEEYSSFALFFMIFIAACASLAKNDHIKMTFFVERLPTEMQKTAEIVSCLAVIICFVVLAYSGVKMAWDTYQYDETSPALGHPMWLYAIWIPILAVIAILRSAGAMIRIIRVRIR